MKSGICKRSFVLKTPDRNRTNTFFDYKSRNIQSDPKTGKL